MGIKFWKFVNKVAHKISAMGFNAPENAKNRLFHFFGMYVDWQTPWEVHFHRKLKSFKTPLE